MLAQEVAKKYSHALFMTVKEKQLLDAVYEQMADLLAYLKTDRSLLGFLHAPHILDEDKLSLVRQTFERRLEPLVVEFLVVLVEKHRIAFLPEVIDEFARLVEAEKGIGRATVMTAVPLINAERTKLIQKLAAKTGLKIELEEKIDPPMLGGMIVILHNEIIDGSVRHGLDLLEDRLAKVKVH